MKRFTLLILSIFILVLLVGCGEEATDKDKEITPTVQVDEEPSATPTEEVEATPTEVPVDPTPTEVPVEPTPTESVGKFEVGDIVDDEEVMSESNGKLYIEYSWNTEDRWVLSLDQVTEDMYVMYEKIPDDAYECGYQELIHEVSGDDENPNIVAYARVNGEEGEFFSLVEGEDYTYEEAKERINSQLNGVVMCAMRPYFYFTDTLGFVLVKCEDKTTELTDAECYQYTTAYWDEEMAKYVEVGTLLIDSEAGFFVEYDDRIYKDGIIDWGGYYAIYEAEQEARIPEYK